MSSVAHDQVRLHGTLFGMSIRWQKADEAGWVAGIITALLTCWLVARFADQGAEADDEVPAEAPGSTQILTRKDATILGIVAGIFSGLVIGVLTFFGPMLIKPEYGLIWLWFSWAIAPVAGTFGGAIIGGLVRRSYIRRVEIAEASAPRPRDSRNR